MKKYEYVNVHVGKLWGARSEERRDVAGRYAARGWRCAGAVPVHMDRHGRLKDMGLVFESELSF